MGVGSVIWISIAGAVTVGVVGVVLLYFGLLHDKNRGRRRCPKCWYDLGGTPDSCTCSECGFVAASERMLRRTRRRWGRSTFGLALVVASVGFFLYADVDPQQIKPVWWLVLEAHQDGATGEEARRELVRRGRADELSVAQQRRIADRVLAVQADPDAAWHLQVGYRDAALEWGVLFEDAWQRGALTDDQVEQFFRTAFESDMVIEIRPRISSGTQIPLRVVRPATSSPRVSSWLGIFNHNERMLLVGSIRSVEGPAPVSRFAGPEVHLFGGSWFGGSGMNLQLNAITSPGEHRIRLLIDFAVVSAAGSWPMTEDVLDGAVARWQQEKSFTVHVLPSFLPSVTFVDEPELEPVIRNALQVELKRPFARIGDTDFHGTHGLILVHPIPVDISFDVFARADRREEYLGAICAYGNETTIQNARGIERDAHRLFRHVEAVDVIFRTSPQAAERTVDIDRIWNGEIVFENVPLRELPR